MSGNKDLEERLGGLFSDKNPMESTPRQSEEKADVPASAIPEKDVEVSNTLDRGAHDIRVDPSRREHLKQPVRSSASPESSSHNASPNPEASRSGVFLGNLSIGVRLSLGFGILFLLSLALGIVPQIGASVESDALDEYTSVVHELDLAQSMNENFLEAFRFEKNFFLYHANEGIEAAKVNYLLPARQYLNDAHAAVAELREIDLSAANVSLNSDVDSEQLANLDEMDKALNQYEALLVQSAAQLEALGQGDTALQQGLNQAAATLKAAPEIASNDEVHALVQEIRHTENDWLLSRSVDTAEQVRALNDQLRRQISDLDIAAPQRYELTQLVDNHRSQFDALVELQTEFAATIIALNEQAERVDQFPDRIIEHEAGETDIALAAFHEAENLSTTLEFSLLIGTVMVSVILSIVVTRSIARPVSQLIGGVKRLAEGELSARVQVQSSDELGVLASTFNSMADQLQDTLEGLEQRVADRTRALKTSTEVGHRLSTILSQVDLVSEVVNQVRSAFNYYHVHIYLLSGDGRELIMAGGTGEAGRAMLTQGHRISWGRGLVGRAAKSDDIVLVPDVSQEPGWLSNPLLPDTRSELAAPISAAGRVLGVLDVQHDVVDGLGQSDVELMQSIASQVAVALHNARLYESSERKAETEALVNKIGQRIQNTTTLDDLLKVAARELGQALGAQRTSLQLSSSMHSANDITTSVS